MRIIKNIAIFGIGTGLGFGCCAAFMTDKLLSCEETREALARVLYEKIGIMLFGESTYYWNKRAMYRPHYQNGRVTYWQH